MKLSKQNKTHVPYFRFGHASAFLALLVTASASRYGRDTALPNHALAVLCALLPVRLLLWSFQQPKILTKSHYGMFASASRVCALCERTRELTDLCSYIFSARLYRYFRFVRATRRRDPRWPAEIVALCCVECARYFRAVVAHGGHREETVSRRVSRFIRICLRLCWHCARSSHC